MRHTVPSGIRLRPAAAEDAAAIWALRVAAIRHGCRDHYPPELLADWTAAPMPETFGSRIAAQAFVVAEREARIAAFAGLDRERREIDAVFVHPDFAGQGLGVLLLSQVESAARQFGMPAVTLKASLNAIPFYTAAGYAAREPGWHVTPGGLRIACLHMEKPLA